MGIHTLRCLCISDSSMNWLVFKPKTLRYIHCLMTFTQVYLGIWRYCASIRTPKAGRVIETNALAEWLVLVTIPEYRPWIPTLLTPYGPTLHRSGGFFTSTYC